MNTSSLAVAIGLVLLSSPAFAQSEAALKAFFEGRKVAVKIDMPASSSGVDVYPSAERPIDFKRYGERIATAGVALKEGETSMITLIKMKKDLIEFHLGGGGYDAYRTGYVSPDYVGKSNLEKQLEKDVKAESDVARKRQLQRQLDDERNRRYREERRNATLAETQTAANKQRIAQERIAAGSRFNLRYNKTVPPGMTPDDVMRALAQYVDFAPGTSKASAPAAGAARTNAPAAAAAGDGLPRKGMLRGEADREFGKPRESSDRREGTLRVTSAVYVRGEQRIVAEFVEDVLIRYTISSR